MDDSKLDLTAFRSHWDVLTQTQKRFVVAMQTHSTKKDAAEAIDISPQTAYNWNGDVDRVIEFVRNETALAMLGMLISAGIEAAMVKINGLKSGDERIAQAVATEILDRNLGKPTQRQEVDHSGSIDIPKFINPINPNES